MDETRPSPPARFRAAIRAYDLHRSVEFYRDGLGLPVISQWDREDGAGFLLDAAGGVVGLLGKPAHIRSRGGGGFLSARGENGPVPPEGGGRCLGARRGEPRRRGSSAPGPTSGGAGGRIRL